MKNIMIMVALSLAMVGCNNNSTTQEVGEPLKVSVEIHDYSCGEPAKFRAKGENLDTNVTIILGDEETSYSNEFGVEVEFEVTVPCPEPVECDVTVPETTIPSNDEPCPEGYETSVSGSQCFLISATCGEGTIFDNTNNSCIVDPEYECEPVIVPPLPPVVVCPEGSTLVGDSCVPNLYQPAYFQDGSHANCIKGYIFEEPLEGETFGLCRLDVASIN